MHQPICVAFLFSILVLPPAAAQQIPDPTFDTAPTVDSWQVVSPGFSDRTWSSDDASLSPFSGSFEGQNQGTVEFATAQFRQCLTGVQPAETYVVYMTAKIPSQSENGWASATMTLYDNLTCNGNNLGIVAISPLLTSSTPDVWTFRRSPGLAAPPAALSIDFRLFLNKTESSGTFIARYDNVSLQLLIFEDGFETGDPTAWSDVVP